MACPTSDVAEGSKDFSSKTVFLPDNQCHVMLETRNCNVIFSLLVHIPFSLGMQLVQNVFLTRAHEHLLQSRVLHVQHFFFLADTEYRKRDHMSQQLA